MSSKKIKRRREHTLEDRYLKVMADLLAFSPWKSRKDLEAEATKIVDRMKENFNE